MLNRWLEQTGQCHSEETMRFLAAERDQFRNPVGHALRENLGILLEQVLGQMQPEPVRTALENIVRIRAVQDLTASQAVEFVFELRPILHESLQKANFERLDAHIDRLALCAFDEYTRCRERIAELRVGESRRAAFAAAERRDPAKHESGTRT